jgi:hypothetical protein
MDLNQQKEQFSNAYLRAVVATAGFGIYRPDPDEDSVDWGVAARGGKGTVRSPRVELQLKCTAADLPDPDSLHYTLKLKNYNDLKAANLLVPRILVVVRVPDQPDDWLRQTEDELALRHCGYWMSLRGRPDTLNETSVTMLLPRRQVFAVGSLREMMTRVGEGGVP